MRALLAVEIVLKEDCEVDLQDLEDYVRRAVLNWSGGLDPEDLLFDSIEKVEAVAKDISTP